MTAFMLLLLINCCGPDAVVSRTIDRLTDAQCHAQGAEWAGSGDKRGFMCLKREYPARRRNAH